MVYGIPPCNDTYLYNVHQIIFIHWEVSDPDKKIIAHNYKQITFVLLFFKTSNLGPENGSISTLPGSNDI